MTFDEWRRWMAKRRTTPAATITDRSLPWVCRDCGTNLEETMA